MSYLFLIITIICIFCRNDMVSLLSHMTVSSMPSRLFGIQHFLKLFINISLCKYLYQHKVGMFSYGQPMCIRELAQLSSACLNVQNLKMLSYLYYLQLCNSVDITHLCCCLPGIYNDSNSSISTNFHMLQQNALNYYYWVIFCLFSFSFSRLDTQ